jgi:hypothetical protein
VGVEWIHLAQDRSTSSNNETIYHDFIEESTSAFNHNEAVSSF